MTETVFKQELDEAIARKDRGFVDYMEYESEPIVKKASSLADPSTA